MRNYRLRPPAEQAAVLRLQQTNWGGRWLLPSPRPANGILQEIEGHRPATALHFACDRFRRVHQTLRMTPAMKARLADHGRHLEGSLLNRRNVKADEMAVKQAKRKTRRVSRERRVDVTRMEYERLRALAEGTHAKVLR